MKTLTVLVMWLLPWLAGLQDAVAQEHITPELDSGAAAGCAYHLIAEELNAGGEVPRPTLVLLLGKRPTPEMAASWLSTIQPAKWTVVVPFVKEEAEAGLDRNGWAALGAVLDHVQRRTLVQGLRFHLVAPSEATLDASLAARALPYEFSSFVWKKPAASIASEAPPYQRWGGYEGDDLNSLLSHPRPEQLHASRLLLRSEIANRLDGFHRAAALAHFDDYFGCFAPGAVFLGTDSTERWTLAEFRAFAKPHFQGESAWKYLPLERHIEIAPGGEFAWYDEILGSRTYGLCRGTGVLRLLEGDWQIAHTSLALLVPNEHAKQAISLWSAEAAPDAPSATTVVYVVRHAEKQAQRRDPDLSEQGRARAISLARKLENVGVQDLICTQYRRTRQTLEPLAEVCGVEIREFPAASTAELIQAILGPLNGHVIVISGHSNTVPEILEELGVESPPTLGEKDYGDLFRVELHAQELLFQRLRF